jgi:hypothetical protein
MSNTWKYVIAGLAVLLLCLVAASTARAAEQACMELDIATKQLEENHGETPIFLGVSRSGYLVMLFLNRTEGTWTVGRVMPKVSDAICILDAGNSGYVQNIKGNTDG